MAGTGKARRPRGSDALRAAVKLLGPRAWPDLDWIARVTGRTETNVERVLREVSQVLEDEEAIFRTLESSGRTYYAQFPAPLDLYAIVRLLRPTHVVESGVSSGLSTAHILMALRKNRKGTLHSMDLPAYQKDAKRRRGELSWSIPPGRGSGWAIPLRLKEGWDLRQGRSEDFLPNLLRELPEVDLYCHDSPWTPRHLAFEFEAIRPHLHAGSIVVADNTDVNPAAPERLARHFGTKVWRRKGTSVAGVRIPVPSLPEADPVRA